MQIITQKIADLTADPKNARKHDQTNLASIKASLEKFGQRKPIVIDGSGKILAGNGTVEAAKLLGWTEIDTVEIPADWDAATAKAYAIADNRTAELADWNGEALLASLQDLPSDLLAATGFNDESVLSLEKLWGDTPDLDKLFDDIGDPTHEDGLTRVSFSVPEDVAARWETAVKAAGAGSYLENLCLAIKIVYDEIVGDDAA